MVVESQKREQIEYHERVHYSAGKPRAIDNRHPYVQWLNGYRLRTALTMAGGAVAGKSVLSVCGGDGQEADYFQRLGARVTMVDLSPIAVQAARVQNPQLECMCMDAERLDFPDGAFDWAIVRDGLHHLARPLKGFYELDRVSREGFIILEGQDSPAVRALSLFGVAENWDPAGGYVYRFGRRELYKIFSSLQTVHDWKVRTAWLPYGSDLVGLFPAFRRYVYPVISHPAAMKVLMTRSVRRAFKCSFEVFNGLFGRAGNSLIVVARKGRT